MKCVLVAYLMLLALLDAPPLSTDPVLKTANRHPMQYYISLPKGWAATKKWPTTKGGTGLRNNPAYHYAPAIWDEVVGQVGVPSI